MLQYNFDEIVLTGAICKVEELELRKLILKRAFIINYIDCIIKGKRYECKL